MRPLRRAADDQPRDRGPPHVRNLTGRSTCFVAARGGTVQWNGFQSAAGYYVVIDLKRSKQDHMYQGGKPRRSVTRKLKRWDGWS